jgi:phospholipase/carboxylesterase
MEQAEIPLVEVVTQQPYDAVVIWLHGLGDSGDGFAPIVPQLNLPAELGIRFVFPHAPIQPVTINNGMPMRAWYDIKSLELHQRADAKGVKESATTVNRLIQMELDKGIKASRIVLAGFSQGGVIAYHAGLRFPQSLAGILALSTYMSESDKLAQEGHEANKATPILVNHGNLDPVVPMELGKQAFDTLQNNSYNATWQTYPMQHSVCQEQIAHISQWLQERL